MDPSGRIPKVPLPEDLPNPERWRYIPEGRIMPGQHLPAPVRVELRVPTVLLPGGRRLRRRDRHHRHRLPRAAAPRVPGRVPHLHDRGAGALPPRLAPLAPSPGDPRGRRRRGGAVLRGGLRRLPAHPHAALLRARARHAGERRVELHGRDDRRGGARRSRAARARRQLDRDRRHSRRAPQPRAGARVRGPQHGPGVPRALRGGRRPERGLSSPPASGTTRGTASTSPTAAGAWAWSPSRRPGRATAASGPS